jgi:hypothetical protein
MINWQDTHPQILGMTSPKLHEDMIDAVDNLLEKQMLNKNKDIFRKVNSLNEEKTND